MKNVVNFHSFKELDELPEGNQGTIEALQEIVRPNRKGDSMKCWWCRRERKCNEYRLKYARGFVPLCECCANGFKDKITEVKA